MPRCCLLYTSLGPEMKSTGEVLGIGNNMEEALYKGLIASGSKMNKNGGVFITVRDGDKKEIGEIAKKFDKMGFPLYATTGTASVLAKLGLSVKIVDKIHESPVNTITLLESGKLAYIISTSAKGRNPARDSVKIRRKAALLGIPCLTAIDTANALADLSLIHISMLTGKAVWREEKAENNKKGVRQRTARYVLEFIIGNFTRGTSDRHKWDTARTPRTSWFPCRPHRSEAHS